MGCYTEIVPEVTNLFLNRGFSKEVNYMKQNVGVYVPCCIMGLVPCIDLNGSSVFSDCPFAL